MLPKVYAFVSPLCGVCVGEQKPHLESFQQAALGRAVVVQLNPNLKKYEMDGRVVRMTPSFAFYDEGGGLKEFVEGQVLTADELEQHAFGEPPPPPKRVRKKKLEEPEEDEAEEDVEDDEEEDEDE